MVLAGVGCPGCAGDGGGEHQGERCGAGRVADLVGLTTTSHPHVLTRPLMPLAELFHIRGIRGEPGETLRAAQRES